jgi:flagellar L-ring protein precursor FlgH
MSGCWVTPTCAQSIWQFRAADRVSLIADTAARHVGDLVTIIVRETTDVDNIDQRSLSRDDETDWSFGFSSSGDVGTAAGDFDFAADSGRSFSGQSQYLVGQDFEDRITVQVLDVLPNGNLVIGGRRRRLVAGELRTLIVSGTVRSVDISPNNTVRSQYISNFKICYEGDGPETHFSNQGWAGRFLNKVWPF